MGWLRLQSEDDWLCRCFAWQRDFDGGEGGMNSAVLFFYLLNMPYAYIILEKATVSYLPMTCLSHWWMMEEYARDIEEGE